MSRTVLPPTPPPKMNEPWSLHPRSVLAKRRWGKRSLKEIWAFYKVPESTEERVTDFILKVHLCCAKLRRCLHGKEKLLMVEQVQSKARLSASITTNAP